ncbi:MFS transporter [Streptomyces avidinii]|uniref:MFS transporter n=1 Tax=Streptomyces avidinii TaxID=1895 RepID=UPI00386893CA
MPLRDFVMGVEPLRTSRDFRAISIARVVSLFGLGMATVALSAQVYGLTRSTFNVAAASVITSITVLLGSLWGGVMADRTDRRRRLIVWARGAAALAFAGLAVNAMLPDPTLWGIYVCVAWDGLATGVSVTVALFNLPVVLFPELVDRQFHGGEVMLGLLCTAPAVGAVAVSATSGWLTRAARPGRLLIISPFTGGLSAVGRAPSPWTVSWPPAGTGARGPISARTRPPSDPVAGGRVPEPRPRVPGRAQVCAR